MTDPVPRAPLATLLAAVAAVVVLVALIAPPAGAQGTPTPAPPTTSPPTTGSAPTGGPHLDLVAQTPFVAPTDTFRLSLDVSGAPAGAQLTFTVWSSVIGAVNNGSTAQSRFDAWVDGTAGRTDAFNSPDTFDLEALPPADGTGRVDAAFQVVPDGVDDPLVGYAIATAGVYPFTVDLTGPDGGPVLDSLTTFLVRLPARGETAPALSVAPLAGIHAPVALRPDGTRTLPADTFGRVDTLADALAANLSVPLTLGATPETLEALVGATPPPGAPERSTGSQLLERLRSALGDRSVLGATYVDVDLPAWARSEMGAVLAYQLSHGTDVTEAVLPGAAPLDQRTWVADATITPEALTELVANGVDRVVLPDAVVGPVDTRANPDPARVQVAAAQPFDVEDSNGALVRAVTTRPSLGQRLVATQDEALNAQTLVADLAVTYFGALSARVNDPPDDRRGVVVEVPDDELALRSLSPFLAALATVPPAGGDGVAILAPTTLAGLFELPPTQAATDGATLVRTVTPPPSADAPEDMGEYPERLDEADFDLSAYESMVVDSNPELVVPMRQLLDVSGAAGFDEDERQQYLDASTRTVDDAMAQVRVPEQDQILLTVSETEITIAIENDLTYPVRARMELASSKLTFPDGDVVDIELAPGRNRLPVRVSTVSGGTFPMSIDVTTPDGRRDLGSGVIEVRSSAISGIGLALTIGAGFFLAVWWARNWRKTRRDAGAATAAGSSPEDPDPADEEPAERRPAGFAIATLEDLEAGNGEPSPTVPPSEQRETTK